jgi:hypothetical protein
MELNEVFYLILAIAGLFLLTAVIVIPFFSNTYEFGGGQLPYQKGGLSTSLTNGYCQATDNSVIACTDCNISAGYSSFLSSCHRLIAANNGSFCYKCTDFGYKSTVNSIMLFVFFIFFIALILIIIVKYLPKFKR